jgi:predicted 2-oxoglutarate/Fe(II)-dependent dioxygenase YbiX
VDLFSLQLFPEEAREQLLNGLRGSSGDAATVYGRAAAGAVDSLVRRTTRLVPSAEALAVVNAALGAAQQQLSEHFGVPLASFEEPQFLRYREGDYFVAHQDGNTPIIRDDSRHRRVSVIVFLSKPSDYAGGALVFHGDYRQPHLRVVAPCEAGTLLAFPSELTHEVMPLTAGERYTIATWYRSEPQ